MNSLPLQSQKPVRRLKTYTNDNILEALRGIGSGVGKGLIKDVAEKTASDALKSLFGGIPQHGELKANQVIDFSQERQPQPRMHRPEVHQPERVVFHEDTAIKQQLDAVRAELKALSKSVQMLSLDIQKAVIETPVSPGTYHITFYEKLRSILKMLREQIDDSRSWLTLHTERKKKMGYWGMFKKHGTTFGLSNERSLATSAG